MGEGRGVELSQIGRGGTVGQWGRGHDRNIRRQSRVFSISSTASESILNSESFTSFRICGGQFQMAAS